LEGLAGSYGEPRELDSFSAQDDKSVSIESERRCLKCSLLSGK
jgi:hypothetical protein